MPDSIPPASGQPAAARLVIRQLKEAPSFWQPVPANGFVRCILDQAMTGSERLCCTNELTVRVPLSPDSLILRLQ
jgi:hypothetical protein